MSECCLSLRLLGASLVGVLVAAGAHASDSRPNLLLVTFDTTRADRLGCYGFEGARTPYIDSLASEGTVFLNTYAQAPQTLPSHTSLMTGHYTITHNVLSNGQRLDDRVLTLAEILSAEGYQTGAIVATAALLSDFNLDQGFETYDDHFDEPGLLAGFKNFFRLISRSKVNPTTTRRADRVADLAGRWLKSAKQKERPFFLWVHFFDPHAPYVHRRDFAKPDEVSTEENSLQASYINEVAFTDHYLGRVLGDLGRLGLERNTLTVFTADHGESLGEHGYFGHRRELYEEIIRIPLIWRLPFKIKAGDVIEGPAMSIDVVPTVLTLLDVEYRPEAFAGRDLFALDRSRHRKVFSMAVKLFTKEPIRTALRYGPNKYIRFDERSRNKLFGIDRDPYEEHNLIQSSGVGEDFDWEGAIRDWFDQFQNTALDDFRMTEEQLEKLRSLGYVK